MTFSERCFEAIHDIADDTKCFRISLAQVIEHVSDGNRRYSDPSNALVQRFFDAWGESPRVIFPATERCPEETVGQWRDDILEISERAPSA